MNVIEKAKEEIKRPKLYILKGKKTQQVINAHKLKNADKLKGDDVLYFWIKWIGESKWRMMTYI